MHTYKNHSWKALPSLGTSVRVREKKHSIKPSTWRMKSLHSPLLPNSLVQRIIIGSFSRSGTPISELKTMELIRTNVHVHTHTHTHRGPLLFQSLLSVVMSNRILCADGNNYIALSYMAATRGYRPLETWQLCWSD